MGTGDGCITVFRPQIAIDRPRSFGKQSPADSTRVMRTDAHLHMIVKQTIKGERLLTDAKK